MTAPPNRLADVYGVSRSVPKTYVSRVAVDGKFVNSLARDKHIVVFGGSKQGKTCLRKTCLQESDYVVIQCGRSTSAETIYATLLKEAGATVSVTETITAEGRHKFGVELGAKASIKVVEVEGKGSYEHERAKGTETERTYFEIDPGDPNDVIRVLASLEFKKYVVLEDFHYLDEDVQRRIAVDLKAFHEKSSLCFIVVAVWRESNRLVLFNGDLAGRLIPVDADEWSTAELTEVVSQGEPLLNVKFAPDVREAVINGCQGNVGMLQEACYRICERENLFLTVTNTVTFSQSAVVQSVYAEIAHEQAGRYENFLADFVGGFQKTELQMYRWIAHVIATASVDELKRGVQATEVHRRIEQVHPHHGRLLYNNTLQALSNIQKLQYAKKVQPVILDFNPNGPTLHVVDGGFLVFLASRDRNDLLRIVNAGQVSDSSEAEPTEATEGDT